MLLKFALEPDAIDNSTTQACNNRLIQAWERFGVLVYPNPRDASIAAIIANLHQAPQRRWQRTWAQVLRHPGRYRYSPMSGGSEFDFSNMQEPSDLAQVNEFEFAVLEETRALELDIPEGEGKLFGDVEGVRLCDIDQSQKFQDSLQRSQELVRIDKSIEDLWQERFQRFAEYSQNVVIFDRFAVRDDTSQNISGLFRLIDFLDRDARGCNITIYSSPDPNINQQAAVESIENSLQSKFCGLNGNGIRSVEVRLFLDRTFRVPGHDRHIRFDDNIFSVGIGVELFRYRNIRQAMHCTQTVLDLNKPEYRERRLDSDRSAHIVTFTVPVGAPNSP